MNLLESLLFGLLSGLTEFLPVSSQAHQTIVLHLLGESADNLLRLFVHLGMLLAVVFCFRSQMARLYREMRLADMPRKHRRRAPDPLAVVEVSLLKTAGWILMPAFFFYHPISALNGRLNYAALFLLLNGVILFLPQLLSTGNKDARTMSRADGVLVGLAGAMGMFPGISAVAALTGMLSARGALREKSLRWSCLLMIPVLMCFMGFDVYGIIANGTALSGVMDLICYLAAAAAAYVGTVAGISAMRSLAAKSGYAGFAFYSWGAALFALILFLTN